MAVKPHGRILICLGFLLNLNACVEQQVVRQTLPPGYYPDPARELHQSLQRIVSNSDWQAAADLPLTLPTADDNALVAAYFHARYPFLGLDAQGIDLFAAKHASLAFFEPQPPFADAVYQRKIKDLNAHSKSLKQALDDIDLHFAQDYMGRAQDPANPVTGIVHFFHVEQRPRLNQQQRVYGIFAHYQAPTPSAATGATAADNATAKTSENGFMRLHALLYDAAQKLFYYNNAEGEKVWLYALAHPTQTPIKIWAGEQKASFMGVKAKGGQCGQSMRDWFEQHHNIDLPDSGYNHLGMGEVRYSEDGEPIALTSSVAFDPEHAKNLIFEEKPPLSADELKNYTDRLTFLNAEFGSLLSGLDNLDIIPDKDYIGASRGSDLLSHLGIARFYTAKKRIKDAENRAVYGEFIHNWNAKHRTGLMNINAIYYDAETSLFYWKNGEGHDKKMWIYGLAEPLEKELAKPFDKLSQQ